MADLFPDLVQWAQRRIAQGLPLQTLPGAANGLAGETIVPAPDGRWAILLQCSAWRARGAPARLAQLQRVVNWLDRPGHKSAAQVLLVRVHAGRWTLFEVPLLDLRVRRPGARYWLSEMPGPQHRLADGKCDRPASDANTPLGG